MLFSKWLYYFAFCYICFSQITLDQFEAFKSRFRLCYDSSRKPLFCFPPLRPPTIMVIILKNLTNTSFSRGTWVPLATLATRITNSCQTYVSSDEIRAFAFQWFFLWPWVVSSYACMVIGIQPEFQILDLSLCNSFFSGTVTWKF